MDRDFVLPDPVNRGDRVAIVATSSGVKKHPAVLEKGKKRLEERFDLEVEVFGTAEKGTEYLNDHPKEKAEDFMKAFERDDVDGVIAVTGGAEQIRVLKHLEDDRIRKNPTRFYGMSDNTNIHFYLWRLGIQSFYGGQILDDLLAEGDIGEYTYGYLEKAFKSSLGSIEPSEKWTDEYFDLSAEEITDDRQRFDTEGWKFWNFSEEVSGTLFGGNMEILVSNLVANRYLPEEDDLEGCVLALETSELKPSVVDIELWLMAMGERNFLQRFSAIIVGRPMREELFGDSSLEEKEEYHENFTEAFKKQVKRYAPDTPVIFDMDFGHSHPKIPLQMGERLSIDPGDESIRFD